MQKHVIMCFLLAVMAVNQIKATTKQRKDREHNNNNQTNKVTFISLFGGFKDQDGSTYINLKNFEEDGDVEVQDGRLTVILPSSQINGQRRKCKSKECRRRKDKSLTNNNQTKTQLNLRNAIQHLKSRSGPIVIMKADDLKKDWCRTERMKRKVTEKGCLTKTVINNFCYGQCNSFFIPRQIRGKRDAENFQSCAYCQPTSHRWISVTLHCPKLIPPIRRKRILRVDKCSCSAGTPTVF